MNVLDSAMVSICREMGILMMKTSYSTIFNEGLDFTCALADRHGDLIAVGEFCPSMIGGMPLIVKTITRELPLSSFSEGDIVIHNDPHRGGLHLPEHTLIKPFYVDGELLGFAACIGHIAEIGGTVPGAFNGEATEIFQEGLCVPPVKIKIKGEDNADVWKMLLANVRTPKHNYGDLRAMIGAVDLGVARITELVGKYGKGVFVKTCRDLMDYSETCMRAELSTFPDGKYSFDDYVENDGIERDKTQSTGSVAALITEAYQGGACSIVASKRFMHGLRDFCTRHGILLIFDDVQVSFGRTGRMFAFEKYDIVPDIVVLGKGIASGLPTAAVAARRSIMDGLKRGSLSSTYGANPLSCVAAIESIDIIQEEGLAQRAEVVGKHMVERRYEGEASPCRRRPRHGPGAGG
ncbi:aminotransferase class III-fold pyridoxal phosphate-dependent enzyme [Raoultella sp. WB_B2P2-3]|uniref:aminotransferase class III-fold pyridoxal phosphate-dependent enzyme n=1 Tax=Raoultella scottii TaxID=3040937 RepID=UPI002F93B6D5